MKSYPFIDFILIKHFVLVINIKYKIKLIQISLLVNSSDKFQIKIECKRKDKETRSVYASLKSIFSKAIFSKALAFNNISPPNFVI